MKERCKTVGGYGIMALLGIMAAFLIAVSFQVVTIQSKAMDPELGPRDIAVIHKWAYLLQEPKKGDLVAFHSNVYSEAGEGSTLIRRVVATEGDLVEIKEGNLYINHHIYNGDTSGSAYMEPMAPVAVGPGKVFVLSDNRDGQLDSRDQAVGQLSRAELAGSVLGRIDRQENE